MRSGSLLLASVLLAHVPLAVTSTTRTARRLGGCKCKGGDSYGAVCRHWDAKDEPAWCTVAKGACGDDTFRGITEYWSHTPCPRGSAKILPFDAKLAAVHDGRVDESGADVADESVNAAGDTEYWWGKWKYDFRGTQMQIGNEFLAHLLSLVTAVDKKEAEWKAQYPPSIRDHPWNVNGVTAIRPYKIVFAEHRQVTLSKPGAVFGRLKEACKPGPRRKWSWACALLLGPDVIGDWMERAVAIWSKITHNADLNKAEPTDAVIHFRCGDVASVIDSLPMYGIPNFEWYAQQVPKEAKRVLIVGNFKGSQSTNSHQAMDAKADGRCALFAKELPKFIKHATGKDCFHIDNGSADADFIMLATAPFMIGSISTFSLAAAACNRHGTSVLPASRLLCHDAKLCASLAFSRIKFAPFRGLWGGKYVGGSFHSGGGLNLSR